MAETKTPKAGEWWIHNEGAGKLFIVGRCNEGHLIVKNSHGHSFGVNETFDKWHHEPRCTGFDWVEPPSIDPGQGYELLGTLKLTPVKSMDLSDNPVELPDDWVEITNPGHVVRSYIDQFMVSAFGGHRWEYAVTEFGGSSLGDIGVSKCRCRRKNLPVAQPAAERIPDNRPARDVIMDIVQWLDPHPPGVSKPQEALDCVEQWLVDNPVTPAGKRALVRLWRTHCSGEVIATINQDEDPIDLTDEADEILHDAGGFYVE